MHADSRTSNLTLVAWTASIYVFGKQQQINSLIAGCEHNDNGIRVELADLNLIP
jgi:hypothetical protein